MSWFGKSLNHKFTIATIAGFLISSVVFLVLFLGFYQNKLEQEKAQAAHDVNRLLQTSLENAMLKRDIDGLITIVQHLGEQENVSAVMIVNPQGKVRFASRPDLEGKIIGKEFIEGLEAHTRFMKDETGREVLRSVNPVHNNPPCQVCHGPLEKHPVNGILLVDYDATSMRH